MKFLPTLDIHKNEFFSTDPNQDPGLISGFRLISDPNPIIGCDCATLLQSNLLLISNNKTEVGPCVFSNGSKYFKRAAGTRKTLTKRKCKQCQRRVAKKGNANSAKEE